MVRDHERLTSVSTMMRLTLLLRILTSAAWMSSVAQPTDLESMTVPAAVMVHGPE